MSHIARRLLPGRRLRLGGSSPSHVSLIVLGQPRRRPAGSGRRLAACQLSCRVGGERGQLVEGDVPHRGRGEGVVLVDDDVAEIDGAAQGRQSLVKRGA
jgi:hypothetical protein